MAQICANLTQTTLDAVSLLLKNPTAFPRCPLLERKVFHSALCTGHEACAKGISESPLSAFISVGKGENLLSCHHVPGYLWAALLSQWGKQEKCNISIVIRGREEKSQNPVVSPSLQLPPPCKYTRVSVAVRMALAELQGPMSSRMLNSRWSGLACDMESSTWSHVEATKFLL